MIQTIALIVTILPTVAPSYSAVIAGLALLLLAFSFGLDVRWLLQNSAQTRAIASEQ